MAFTDRIIIQFGNSRKDLSLTSCVTHQWAKYVRSCCWYCKVNIDKWIYHPKQHADKVRSQRKHCGKAISYQVTLSDLFNITSIPQLSLMLATSRYPRFTHYNKNIMNSLLSLIFCNKPFFQRVFMKYPQNIIKSGSYIILIQYTWNWKPLLLRRQEIGDKESINCWLQRVLKQYGRMLQMQAPSEEMLKG